MNFLVDLTPLAEYYSNQGNNQKQLIQAPTQILLFGYFSNSSHSLSGKNKLLISKLKKKKKTNILKQNKFLLIFSLAVFSMFMHVLLTAELPRSYIDLFGWMIFPILSYLGFLVITQSEFNILIFQHYKATFSLSILRISRFF